MIGKKVVLPGQVLGKKEKNNIGGYGTFTDHDKIISKYVGFVQKRNKFVNVIPFKRLYIPEEGDTVIGKVVEKNVVLWKLDINAPYTATLRPADVFSTKDRGRGRGRSNRAKKNTKKFKVGDLLLLRIKNFKGVDPSLTTYGSSKLGKIKNGTISEIETTKIPALIGNKGSMTKMLQKMLSCKLFVADNGVVLIQAKNSKIEKQVIAILGFIEANAFQPNLKELVKKKIRASRH